MKLYSYFRSSAAYRVRVALNLKNLDYEYVPVHLLNDGGEHRKESFKELNPMGQLPALETKDGVLNQSMAILQYLDEINPSPKLFPNDAFQKAEVIEICEIVNSGIHPIQNLSVMQHIDQKFSVGGPGKVEWAHHWIDRGFQGLEKKLEKTAGEYAYGDELTAADLLIVPQVYNANRFKVDMNQYPTIARVEENCLKLEAFKKSEPGSQPDTPEE